MTEVPALWQHELMSHQERKEILRCLIDHIVVMAEKERVDATIVWKSGAKSPVFVWRPRSRHYLIRELRAAANGRGDKGAFGGRQNLDRSEYKY